MTEINDSLYGNMYANAAVLGLITVVCVLVAVIGAFVLYFTFLSKKNENRFKKVAGWLYNFFNFKTICAEVLLKIGYLIFFIFINMFQLGVLFFTAGESLGVKLFKCVIGIVIWNVLAYAIYAQFNK